MNVFELIKGEAIGYKEWYDLSSEEQELICNEVIKLVAPPHNSWTEKFSIYTRQAEDEYKSNNGGDYNEWLEFRPSDIPGIFFVWSKTSCDFDDCGTGFEGCAAITKEDYEELTREYI